MRNAHSRGFTPTPILAWLQLFFKNSIANLKFLPKKQFSRSSSLQQKTMPKLVSGFTLIELLIAIAIIGILSSIVLASLNIARSKSANSAVKANLGGIRAQADIVYDNNSYDYTTVCADPNIMTAITAAMTASADLTGTVANRCNSNTSGWAVNVLFKIPENGNTYWCVDSEGTVKGEPAELAGAFVCV